MITNNQTETDDKKDMTAVAQEFVDGRFTDFMDITIKEYRPGYCLAEFKISPRYINPLGGIHGGYLFTIGDSTAGLASVHLGSEGVVTTIDGSMQYLNAAVGCDKIYAQATMLKDGKRIAFTEVTLRGEDGTIYARGSYSFARIVLPHVSAANPKEQ